MIHVLIQVLNAARGRRSTAQPLQLSQVVSSLGFGVGASLDDGANSKDDVAEGNLAILEDADGKQYKICECYVKYYAFRMAILRFAVTANFDDSVNSEISCNNVLSMQDVVMRIGNNLSQTTGSKPTGLKMMNIKTSELIGDFNPGMFVRGILDYVN